MVAAGIGPTRGASHRQHNDPYGVGVSDATGPAADADGPSGQHSDAVDVVDKDSRGRAASTLDVVLAQTAGSSDPEDRDDVAGAAYDGGHTVAGAPASSDLTASVVLVDNPTAWPGQLIGSIGTVGTVSTNAAATPPAEWQRVATGFLLGYAGASRAAYAADLRDYLTWWADTTIPDQLSHPTAPDRDGDGRPPGAISSPGSRTRDGHGGDPLTARRADVDAYAGALREAGASPATISRRLATLSGYYGYAVDDQLIDRSPTTRVRRPKVGEHAVSTGLSRDELTALVTAAQTDGPRSLVAVLLLGLNGLRVSEVCTAVAEGLSTERGHRVLTIVRKGGRTARVPLAPRTSQAIDELLAGRTHGPLLPTRTGRAMDRHAVWRLLRRLATTAVPDKAGSLHPHDLRHAFVTLALDTGASLRDVQDAAGHADPRTTRRYDRARHNLDRHPTYTLAGLLTQEN